ncbi:MULTISPECIES: ABC transporter ATP-binding protein [Streptomyces]|uniref:ABC transporter ATP-binding protein n=1 Tax=Streptomyces TaxID=1883 RepID=UPI001E349C84|nr:MULTISPECIES: ABC transporter ATP-binding protein [Streptomyces]UFQ17197.1 ABC transporter ATP-binding protein [Streptomyces huasconensis]WCL86799.1 ABC transporter ATP-binding protein [Streptomyces sp. JCM 35825]
MNETASTAASATASTAVRLTAVRRLHGDVAALDGVDLEVASGTFVAVMGPSGSGKSTLLQCAAGLDRPTSGTVEVGGTPLTGLSERRLTLLRRERVGFVFQAFNLIPSLSAAQNVALPLRLAGRRPSRTEIRDALGRVGLADRARHRPGGLSGGQQQRVALARALVTRPAVLFGDEPTGALDTGTGRQVLGLLRGLVDGEGQTTVMVTHDPVAAAYADRVVFLVDGRVAGELRSPDAGGVAERMAALDGGGVGAVGAVGAEAGEFVRAGARGGRGCADGRGGL